MGLLLVAGSTPSLAPFTGARPAWGQERTALIEYTDAETTHRAGPHDLRLRVGGADGVDLYAVTDILPRRDGSFVVVNRGTSELYLFDSSGAHLWSAGKSGKSGEGPGEFTDISHVVLLPGDSLAVLDLRARRVSLFDPDGDFVESFPLEPPFDGAGSATLLIALSDRTLLIGHSEVRTMNPRPEAVYFRQRLVRYSTGGERLSTEGLSIPASEHFVQALPEELRMGSVAYWSLAFGRTMTVHADPGGGILMGDGTEWAVERRSADGSVLLTHRLARAIEPVTAADRAEFRRRQIEGASRREVAEKEADEMPYPATKPAYRRFEVDDAGRLWLESYAPSQAEEGALWIRLDPGTRAAAAIRFPPRYRAFAFRGDLVYGILRDELDIEYVHVYSTESM